MENQNVPDYVNAHLKKHHKLRDITWRGSPYQDLAPRIKCKDGLELSVQASDTHYSSPRDIAAYPYTMVEIGFPSQRIDEIMKWCEDPDSPLDTVYGYVPTPIVNEVIHAHGGPAEESNA